MACFYLNQYKLLLVTVLKRSAVCAASMHPSHSPPPSHQQKGRCASPQLLLPLSSQLSLY